MRNTASEIRREIVAHEMGAQLQFHLPVFVWEQDVVFDVQNALWKHTAVPFIYKWKTAWKKTLCNSSSGGSASLNELQLARHSNFLWNSSLNRAPWGSAAWRDCHGDHYLCREKPTGCFQGKLHRNVTLAVLDKNNTPRWFKVTEDSWSLFFFVLIWNYLVHSSLESF